MSMLTNANRIERQTRIEDAVIRLLDKEDMTLDEIAEKLRMTRRTLIVATGHLRKIHKIYYDGMYRTFRLRKDFV